MCIYGALPKLVQKRSLPQMYQFSTVCFIKVHHKCLKCHTAHLCAPLADMWLVVMCPDDSFENKVVLHTTSVGGVLTTSARPARQPTSQSDRQMNRQTDSNQYVAVSATAIMSFYGAKCLARLRAVREKMLMAPPVPPVSLHHLSDCSYWERGREERTNWDSNCNFSLHSQQEDGGLVWIFFLLKWIFDVDEVKIGHHC